MRTALAIRRHSVATAVAVLGTLGNAASQIPQRTSTVTGATTSAPALNLAYVLYGKVTSTSASVATAQRLASTPKEALTAWGPGSAITYGYSSEVVPGMPVERSLDGKKVRYARFPVLLASTGQMTVGKGTGKGRFWMETKNLKLSLAPSGSMGILSAQTQVQSEDVINGFSGEVWVRITDVSDQEVVLPVKAGCWGVNPRSGVTKTWRVSLPRPEVAAARKVEVLVGNGCKNSWSAAMGNVRKAAEAIAPLVEAYVKAQSGTGG